jgi:hypothetical protein
MQSTNISKLKFMFRVVDLWQERDIDFLVSSKNSPPPILFKIFVWNGNNFESVRAGLKF